MLSVVVPACNEEGSVHNKVLLLLVLVSLLALALRLYQIDRESFWLDEAFSYWAASNSSEDIIFRQETRDDNPPFYYLVLHYWMKMLGESDWAIRFLSAIFGVLAIPIVFQLGKQLFNDHFGLIAALFLAVSPFHIQYSQEARSYSLYFFLTSLSHFFLGYANFDRERKLLLPKASPSCHGLYVRYFPG